MRAAALLLIACCTALSPHASVLKRCGSATPPSAAEATQALRAIVAEERQDDWAPLFDKRWRPVFSVKPDADMGRLLSVRAEQTFRSDGSFSNAVGLFRGALKFIFKGTYALKGSATTLVIERLRLRILGVPLPSIDVREGKGIRALVERVRGGRKGGKGFQKRPNVYSWCYADDAICVARGSSGSTAVWVTCM